MSPGKDRPTPAPEGLPTVHTDKSLATVRGMAVATDMHGTAVGTAKSVLSGPFLFQISIQILSVSGKTAEKFCF